MGRGRAGPAPLVAKREQYARLIARGVPRERACRIVGINPRTRKHWRHGRTITTRSGRRLHYPPVINTCKVDISSRYLSEDERIAIADLHRGGGSVRAIAGELGRSPATVSRELRRNTDPRSGQYRPFVAQQLAVGRRTRQGRGKLVSDAQLREFVDYRLQKRWSPEQIGRALREHFPDQPARHLVHETIYQAIYRAELGGLHHGAPKMLRTGRTRRRPRRRGDARRPRNSLQMVTIDQRPAEAASRSVAGHWEGDLITGKHNRWSIGTLVDRCSRFTMLLHLPQRHTAEALRDPLITAFAGLPPSLRRSLTWDQGRELALHCTMKSPPL